jgi:phosphate transport system substrate-binding protein
LFTHYLTATSKAWTAGAGTTVRWPQVPGMLAVRGNDGMVKACERNDGSIAYVAVSYVPQLAFGDLNYAALRARDGSYVLPTVESMAAAVAGANVDQDGRASLIDRPGRDAYPIVSYEYAIVRRHQSDAARAQALKNFFAWAISPNGGNDEARFLSALDFVPLPERTRAVSTRLIQQIQPAP